MKLASLIAGALAFACAMLAHAQTARLAATVLNKDGKGAIVVQTNSDLLAVF